MFFWNSNIFKKYPLITELFTRFLLSGFSGRIIELLLAPESAVFKMFPFSTDPIYKDIDVHSEDKSGIKHTSSNGNIWLSCNCPKGKELFIEVTI